MKSIKLYMPFHLIPFLLRVNFLIRIHHRFRPRLNQHTNRRFNTQSIYIILSNCKNAMNVVRTEIGYQKTPNAIGKTIRSFLMPSITHPSFLCPHQIGIFYGVIHIFCLKETCHMGVFFYFLRFYQILVLVLLTYRFISMSIGAGLHCEHCVF